MWEARSIPTILPKSLRFAVPVRSSYMRPAWGTEIYEGRGKQRRDQYWQSSPPWENKCSFRRFTSQSPEKVGILMPIWWHSPIFSHDIFHRGELSGAPLSTGHKESTAMQTHNITHVLLDFSFLFFFKFGVIVKRRQDEANGTLPAAELWLRSVDLLLHWCFLERSEQASADLT